MTEFDVFLLIATILGPVLAVQAQKFIEMSRENRQRRLRIFSTLMGTRATRISTDHVQALNSIDIAFYGHTIFGFRWQSKKEKSVESAWRDYQDHLNQPFNDDAITIWFERGDDLFISLLHLMAISLGFSFERVWLKRGIYQPKGHNENEVAILAIRDSLVKILSGQSPLKMDVTSLPITAEDATRQKDIQNALLQQLSGNVPLKVEVINTAAINEGILS